MFRKRSKNSDGENMPSERNEDAPELEKGDIPAMLIAAFTVFLPVAIIVTGIILGVLWLFFFC